VDVNVHPTKHEVRFAEQKKVHEAVQAAVSEALRGGDRPQWTPAKTAEFKDAKPGRVSEPVLPFSRNKARAGYQIGADKSDQKTEAPITQAEIWKEKRFGELRVIGQFYGTYILCESTDALVLIDQHAAHERIIFEQLKKQSHASRKASQKLLVPETIELGFREAEILTKLIPDLETLGLEIEPFGGNTFVTKAVPALIASKAIAPLVVEMVEKIAAIGFGPRLGDVMEACLVIMACHGTIRANQPLSDPEIEHLLKQLDECENPSHCPHGRPTWINWPLRSIEKSFGRTL
jgi:DNA mismatch repair protein MutL